MPADGIVLTQDPIGLAGGVNLYAYAGNNPVAYSDPFGLCPPYPCADPQQELIMRVGGLLRPVQRPLELAGTLAMAPLMISGEGALVTLGLAGRATQATATFYRGVSAAEAADIVANGNSLRAGATAAGNAGKYVTNTVEAASRWAAQNGAGSQVVKITMPADAARALTPLNAGARLDGIGRAWWGPIKAFRDAAVEFVQDAMVSAP